MRRTFVNLAMEVKKKKDFYRLRTQKREKIKNFPYRKILMTLVIIFSFGIGAWSVKTGASIIAEGTSSMKTPGASMLERNNVEFDAVSGFVRESALKLSDSSAASQVKWKSGTEKENISYTLELFSRNRSSSYIIDEIYKIKRNEDSFFYQARFHPVDFPERKLVLNAVTGKGTEKNLELEALEEE